MKECKKCGSTRFHVEEAAIYNGEVVDGVLRYSAKHGDPSIEHVWCADSKCAAEYTESDFEKIESTS